jgi:hypothetical protein
MSKKADANEVYREIRNCVNCSSGFFVQRYRAKNGKGDFCSWECRIKYGQHRKSKTLTLEEINKWLDINFDTGEVLWRTQPERSNRDKKFNEKFSGKSALIRSSRDHLRVCINGQTYAAHNIIWMAAHSLEKLPRVRHVDGDPKNIRLSNLGIFEKITQRGRDVTADELERLFSLDPKTGILMHKPRPIRFGHAGVDKCWNAQWVGKEAGVKGTQGHIYVRIFNKSYAAHRVIWAMVHRRWPKNEIDHINGVYDDNRVENLREATHLENMKNQKIRTDNTSGHRGVSMCPKTGKWLAYITKDKKFTFLGRFERLDDAVRARKAAAHEMYGEFNRIYT